MSVICTNTSLGPNPCTPKGTCARATPNESSTVKKTHFCETTTVIYVSREEEEIGSTLPQNQGLWGNRLEFFLVCLGYRVDHLSMLRFPYFIYTHGGVNCLLPCAVSVFVLGVPFHLLETALGQFSGLGPVKIWNLCPLYKGVGFSMLVFQLIFALHNSVRVPIEMVYLIESARGRHTWASCGNKWNSPDCWAPRSDVITHINLHKNVSDVTAEINMHNSTISSTSAGAEYFKHLIDDHAAITLCSCFQWTITCLVIQGPISRLGKVAYLLTLLPYLFLLVLTVESYWLEGSQYGVSDFLYPKSQPSQIQIWIQSAYNVYILLGCSTGPVIAMSSFNSFQSPLLLHTVMIPVLKAMSSFVFGLVIASTLGYACEKWKTSIGSLALEDQMFMFYIYPNVVSALPRPYVSAFAFFCMLFLFGLGAHFLSLKCIVYSLEQECPHFNNLLSLLCCFLGFVLSSLSVRELVPMHETEQSLTDLTLLLIGLHFCVVITWIYGVARLSEDVGYMMGKSHALTKRTITVCIWILALIAPFTLGGILFNELLQHKYYKAWYYIVCGPAIIFGIIVYGINTYFKGVYHNSQQGIEKQPAFKLLRKLLSPSREWKILQMAFKKSAHGLPTTLSSETLLTIHGKLKPESSTPPAGKQTPKMIIAHRDSYIQHHEKKKIRWKRKSSPPMRIKSPVIGDF